MERELMADTWLNEFLVSGATALIILVPLLVIEWLDRKDRKK